MRKCNYTSFTDTGCKIGMRFTPTLSQQITKLPAHFMDKVNLKSASCLYLAFITIGFPPRPHLPFMVQPLPSPLLRKSSYKVPSTFSLAKPSMVNFQYFSDCLPIPPFLKLPLLILCVSPISLTVLSQSPPGLLSVLPCVM